MADTTLLDLIEHRVMTRLKQRLDEEVKELSLHNSSVEDFQNIQGCGKSIKVQRARVVGELSSPDLLIDFEWDQDSTGLGIKQWTLFFEDIGRKLSFGPRALIMTSENDEARVDWSMHRMPIPDGHGPFLGSDLHLSIGQTEERADWLLSLAIGLGLDEFDKKWEKYYDDYRPSGLEVMYNWVKYPFDAVARWAVFLENLGASFSNESYHSYNLGDGIWYSSDFLISWWDLRIVVKEEPPSEQEQDYIRRLGKGMTAVLVTFGELNTKGWLFRGGEKMAGNCRILDCLNCDRTVLCLHEEGPDGGRWSWDLLGKPAWCNEENCAKQMPPLISWDWAKSLIRNPKSNREPEYSIQNPGLYNKVKAAQDIAKSERFGVAILDAAEDDADHPGSFPTRRIDF
ncbi:MAG: hypothetical protein HN578_14825 [Rhodospirillales bacterium]|jgi:hypothetical protein|nr:hypothetical protein [Rhodospirillales bacterium]